VVLGCLLAVLPLTVAVGGYDEGVLAPIGVVYVMLGAGAGLLYVTWLRRRDRGSLVTAFRVVVVASVLFTVGWLTAVA
jgi:hypothetical protein